MREIKFRFWSGDRMFYQLETVMACLTQQLAFNQNDIRLAHYDHAGIDKSSFMQFTGLKDKNGKEIYEGDIVKRRVHLVEGKDYLDYNCEVRWNGWCYGLFVGKGDHGKQLWGLDPITAKEVEVIGNIYEK